MRLAILILAAAVSQPASPQHLSAMAERPGYAPGVPACSDVIMRSLRIHPTKPGDPHDTLAAARAFHVTRLEWVYASPEEIRRLRGDGLFIGASVNSLYRRKDAPAGDHTGWCVDRAGNRVTAPWMKNWDVYWGCVNSPEFRDYFLSQALDLLRAGAHALQTDDPAMNQGAVNWGGCFCTHCMRGFRAYLKEEAGGDALAEWGIADLDGFDYGAYLDAHGEAPKQLAQRFAAFQTASTRAFHRDIHAAIDTALGRHVARSSNNGFSRWDTPYDLFDYGMGEVHPQHLSVPDMHAAIARSRALGKMQVYTAPKPVPEPALVRKCIASVYALGGVMMAPWDVYQGDAPRYFGQPQDFADLFAFVRANAERLDGYEEAAVLGPDISVPEGLAAYPVTLPEDRQVYAFFRARPGEATAPVVVHLVDWSDAPDALELVLHPEPFFGGGAPSVTLHTPDGEKALPVEPAGAKGWRLSVPALRPWGMLSVRFEGR